ncbi:class I SAM-dependent methyltransferase [Candidatus Parcubacteria bacterium]|nr:MAG: class I SAM-dependent methyltransferase [Candidatus Parcubacteria bacterium]
MFKFGKNWLRFLDTKNQEQRLAIAVDSIKTFMGVENLNGKVFIDAGCGSGFFSLAAWKLGAEVISFDLDPECVTCCEYYKKKYAFNPGNWTILKGSVLDRNFLATLPKGDVVYSYGVLHHTGNLKQAMENVETLVKDRGYLYIAIYNKVYGRNGSKCWQKRKARYNRLPIFLQWLMVVKYLIRNGFIPEILNGKNPLKEWQEYKVKRGESKWVDAIDWVGAYPYEFLRPDEVFNFYKKNYDLVNLLTKNTLALNVYLFKKK